MTRPYDDGGKQIMPKFPKMITRIQNEEKREFISTKRALAMIADGDRIHVTTEPRPGIMVGAEWDRQDVIFLIKSGKPELTGPIASKAGYRLAVDSYFIRTRPEDD